MHEISEGSSEPYLYFARIDSNEIIWLIEGGGSREYLLNPTVEENQVYTHGKYNITVTHPDIVLPNNVTLKNVIDFYIDAPQIADEETGYVFSPGIGLVRIYGAWGTDFRLISNVLK